MAKKIVYLSEELAPSVYQRLKNKYEIVQDFDNIEKIEGIITRKIPITREIITRAKNLKVIANHGTGKDQIDLQAAKEREIPVLSAPGLNAISVAELTLAFMLSLSYKIKFADSGLQNGNFSKFGLPELNGNEVRGKILGVIGTGFIAKEVSRMFKAIFNEAFVYAYNPHKTKEELKEMGFEKVEKLEELFKICNFVSVHAPLNNETKNLINKNILEQANKNLILINTSRGGIINETDLYEALVKNQIKACACDVFEVEPPVKENPLLKLPNFIATPHVGGSSWEALERVGNKTVDNLDLYLS